MDLYPGRFYLELHRTGREGDETHLHAAVALASELQCPVVATNDVRFLDASEFEAHEARVCIREGRSLDDPRRARLHRPAVPALARRRWRSCSPIFPRR